MEKVNRLAMALLIKAQLVAILHHTTSTYLVHVPETLKLFTAHTASDLANKLRKYQQTFLKEK